MSALHCFMANLGCGRVDECVAVSTISIARDAYRGLFKAQRLPKSNFPLRYNVAPTDQIPIVRIDPRDGEREVVMARWDDPVLDEGETQSPSHQRSC